MMAYKTEGKWLIYTFVILLLTMLIVWVTICISFHGKRGIIIAIEEKMKVIS